MSDKSEFKITIRKEDNLYRAWVEDYPHIRALSYNLDTVKLNIKECIEVWTDTVDPKIIFNIKQ